MIELKKALDFACEIRERAYTMRQNGLATTRHDIECAAEIIRELVAEVKAKDELLESIGDHASNLEADNRDLVEENAKLRRVAEAAEAVVKWRAGGGSYGAVQRLMELISEMGQALAEIEDGGE